MGEARSCSPARRCLVPGSATRRMVGGRELAGNVLGHCEPGTCDKVADWVSSPALAGRDIVLFPLARGSLVCRSGWHERP